MQNSVIVDVIVNKNETADYIRDQADKMELNLKNDENNDKTDYDNGISISNGNETTNTVGIINSLEVELKCPNCNSLKQDSDRRNKV